MVHAISAVLIHPKKISNDEKNEDDITSDFNNVRYNLGTQSRNRNFWWAFEMTRKF